MTSGISGVTNTSSTATSVSGNASEIAGNFTQFLTLLTTQLKNQNPLDPMDTNQFTKQLVQYAGVEQQLKSNDRLEIGELRLGHELYRQEHHGRW